MPCSAPPLPTPLATRAMNDRASRFAIAVGILVAACFSPPRSMAQDTPTSSSATTTVEATQEPTSPTLSEEIVVTATRDERALLDVPASVSVESMQALRDRGFFVAADELRAQPGLFFRRGEGDNDDFLSINVRGVTGNHGNDTFLALIDGVPFIAADEEVLMNDIPYAAVEEVEIVRGPVSALYGRGGIAGAIAYSTTAGSGEKFGLDLLGGSDGLASGTLRGGFVREPLRFFGTFTHEQSEGWRAQNERDFSNGFLKLLATPNERDSISFWGNFLDKNYEVGSPIPLLPDGTPVEGLFGGREGNIGTRSIGRDPGSERESAYLTLRWNRIVSPRATVDATLHHRRLDSKVRYDFFDPFGFDPSRSVVTFNGFDAESAERTFFGGTTVSWATAKTQTLAGVEVEQVTIDDLESWSGQYGFDFECGFAFYAIEVDWRTGRVLNADHPCFVRRQPQTATDGRNRFSAAFAQTEIAIADRWKVQLGGRYDRFERRADQSTGVPITPRPRTNDVADNFAPKLSLSFAATADHVLYASYGEGFSSNFGPFWQWDPSLYIRQTKPTRLENLEIGAKGSFAQGRFSYTLALYDIEQTNRLVFLSNPDALLDFTAPPNLISTGQLYATRGLELATRSRLGRKTRLDVTLGHVDAEWKKLEIETFGGTLDFSGRRPTGVPSNTFSAAIEHRFSPTWNARLGWEWYDDYAVTQDNAVEGGGYDLANLALTWNPERFRLSRVTLAATNLFDENYNFLFGDRDSATYAVAGVPRQLRLSAAWSW